jgi:hypothetical protein
VLVRGRHLLIFLSFHKSSAILRQLFSSLSNVRSDYDGCYREKMIIIRIVPDKSLIIKSMHQIESYYCLFLSALYVRNHASILFKVVYLYSNHVHFYNNNSATYLLNILVKILPCFRFRQFLIHCFPPSLDIITLIC